MLGREMIFLRSAEISDTRRLRRVPTLSIVNAPRMNHDDRSLAGVEMIGHLDDQTTVPIGCEAELDVAAGTLTLLENAVA